MIQLALRSLFFAVPDTKKNNLIVSVPHIYSSLLTVNNRLVAIKNDNPFLRQNIHKAKPITSRQISSRSRETQKTLF